MKTRSSRSAAKFGTAALVSFSLVAAACGGSDDAEPADTETADTEAPTATEADGDTEPESDGEGDGEADGDGEAEGDTVVEGQADTGDVAAEEDVVPVPGGTLRYGLEADVNGINPASSSLSSPGLLMGNAVFDTLALFTPDGEAVPFLAESFTSNDDFTQWQVKVRDGVTFHDGTPLNADALIANFETQRADPLVGLAVRPFYPETGATEKIDELTVQYNLLDANAYFPGALASQLGMIASPTWLAATVEDPTLNQAPVGTGPFVFDSRSEDSVTRFVRNDDWWGGEVYLDAVEFLPVTDPDTRVDLLFSGELDALQTTNPASVDDLRSDDSIQNIIDETGEESFAMINSAAPPFDDIRARQALANATPLQNYRDLINFGVARDANQRFVPESKFYNPDIPPQAGDDPEVALALVADYCAERGTEVNPVLGGPTCTDGKINMEFQWSGPAVVQTRIAEILDQGWSAAGFNVTFDEVPQDDHILQTALGQYNVNTWRQFGATDPWADNVWLLCRTIGGISLNWPRFCDESRDALLLEAQATTDEAERIALYQEAEQKISDAFTYVFFNHTIWDNAFSENVRGICDRVTPEGEPTQCAGGGRTWFSTVWLEG